MSAIAGMIDWRGDPTVHKAITAVIRCGRDGEGFWDGGNDPDHSTPAT